MLTKIRKIEFTLVMALFPLFQLDRYLFRKRNFSILDSF